MQTDNLLHQILKNITSTLKMWLWVAFFEQVEFRLWYTTFSPERTVPSHKWLSPFIMCLWPTWKVPLLLLLLKNWVSPWLSIRCEKRKRSQGTKKWSSQNKTQTWLKEARGEGPITLLRIHKRNIFGCWRRRFGGCIKNQRNWLFCLNN